MVYISFEKKLVLK